MRYPNGITVMLPWFDATGSRTHSRFAFRGDVDRRRVRRSIRKSMRKAGMSPRKYYLDHYIAHHSFERDPTAN